MIENKADKNRTRYLSLEKNKIKFVHPFLMICVEERAVVGTLDKIYIGNFGSV